MLSLGLTSTVMVCPVRVFTKNSMMLRNLYRFSRKKSQKTQWRRRERVLFIGRRHFIAFPCCISPSQHFYDKLKSKDCSFCLRDCFCCVFPRFQRNFYGTARDCFQSRGKRNCTPRGPLTYFIKWRGVRQRIIFHTPKNPNFPKSQNQFSLSLFLHSNVIIL